MDDWPTSTIDSKYLAEMPLLVGQIVSFLFLFIELIKAVFFISNEISPKKWRIVKSFNPCLLGVCS